MADDQENFDAKRLELSRARPYSAHWFGGEEWQINRGRDVIAFCLSIEKAASLIQMLNECERAKEGG